MTAMKPALILVLALFIVACTGTGELPERIAMGLPDYDEDGVPDRDDRCRGTPAATPVDRRGCPRDEDGDGVLDHLDRCPATPAGADLDEFGCVIETVAEAETGLALPVERVNFALDSAEVDEQARTALADVAALLAQYPERRLALVGHADETGPETYNQTLSERRAEAVATYLAARGIAPARLETSGRGEREPLIPDATDDGHAANRRVELSLL